MIHTRLARSIRKTARHLVDVADDERGDVPGWVLITLMTAGLVVVIWALAGPALAALFEQAISQVSGF
jgi:carbon starvation protein CstA